MHRIRAEPPAGPGTPPPARLRGGRTRFAACSLPSVRSRSRSPSASPASRPMHLPVERTSGHPLELASGAVHRGGNRTRRSPFAFGLVHAHLAAAPRSRCSSASSTAGLAEMVGPFAPHFRPRHPHPRLRPCRRRVGSPHARRDPHLDAGLRRRPERLPGPADGAAAGVRRARHAPGDARPSATSSSAAASPAPTSPGSPTSRCSSDAAGRASPDAVEPNARSGRDCRRRAAVRTRAGAEFEDLLLNTPRIWQQLRCVSRPNAAPPAAR